MARIITSYIRPPVPSRRFDWAAWVDGREESGQVGYGATEAEALAELREMRLDDGEEI
jgi:hypothetical protein